MEHSASEPHPFWSARACPRFRQATCRRRMRQGVQLSRAAGRGPALATSRQRGKSGDKSPHSKLFAPGENFPHPFTKKEGVNDRLNPFVRPLSGATGAGRIPADSLSFLGGRRGSSSFVIRGQWLEAPTGASLPRFCFPLRFLVLALVQCAFWLGSPAAQAAPLTIGVIGDYGSAYLGDASFSNVQAVANLIKSWNPDFIITTGDNNYPDGEASNIDTNIGQFFHEYIYPYVGTFGEGASSNRFFPCIGNHEWPFGVSGLAPYLAYFTLPGNERYYNHRHGPVELFAVVGDQRDTGGSTPTSIQAMWLSNALASSTAPWRVVYFHACPYSSSATHGSFTHQADNMLWPFTEWGATAIYKGHNHLYERVLTNGSTYVTIALVGGPLA